MSAKARSAGLALRPHCKTHQSQEIASWFRPFDITKITVSSFDMAGYFAASGWQDILVAFPFNPLEISRLDELAGKCRMAVLVDHMDALKALKVLDNRAYLYIDIDIGYGRTGVRSDQLQRIEDLIKASRQNPNLVFSGFYCHAGHSYKAGSRVDQDEIHHKAMSDLSRLKKHFSGYGPLVLYGDTPNCSMQTSFGEVDQITPGNFIFYDLIQVSIGSCSESDIAIAMACPVSGKYPDAKKIVIHGGAVHFSKETLKVDGRPIFGKQVNLTRKGWTAKEDGAYLTSITQEHGMVDMTEELLSKVEIGDLLAFHPVHSCLTANLMNQYTTLSGDVIQMM